MGNTESLMQIQVTNVCSKIGRAAKPNKGIHVGTIHINLTPEFVDDFANFPDTFFEHPVRRRIRHHQNAEAFGILLGFFPEISEVDIPLGIALNRDDLESSHRRRRRICSVR
jgi:hypothetical protein